MILGCPGRSQKLEILQGELQQRARESDGGGRGGEKVKREESKLYSPYTTGWSIRWIFGRMPIPTAHRTSNSLAAHLASPFPTRLQTTDYILAFLSPFPSPLRYPRIDDTVFYSHPLASSLESFMSRTLSAHLSLLYQKFRSLDESLLATLPQTTYCDAYRYVFQIYGPPATLWHIRAKHDQTVEIRECQQSWLHGWSITRN